MNERSKPVCLCVNAGHKTQRDRLQETLSVLEPKAVALRQSAAEHRAELEGLRHAEDGGAAAAAAAAAEVSITALAGCFAHHQRLD